MAHSSLRDHRKLKSLCRRLTIPEPHAIGYLQLLWWSVEASKDVGPYGALRGWTSEHIADAAEWETDVPAPEHQADGFCEALVASGFLELHGGVYHVHHYAEWCSKFVLKRWKDQGLRKSEARPLPQELQDLLSCGNKCEQVPTCGDLCRNVAYTQPNPTKPNVTKPKTKAVSRVPKDEELKSLDDLPLDFQIDAFREAWSTWVDSRRETRHPLTANAAKIAKGKCVRWGVAKSIQALNDSTVGGWQGLFEPKENQGGNRNAATPNRVQAPPGKYANVGTIVPAARPPPGRDDDRPDLAAAG